MSIEVKFSILNLCLGGDPYEDIVTTEDELFSNLEKYRADLTQLRAFEGGIISISSLDSPDNAIEIRDDLGVLIHQLCFEGVIKLVSNQPVEFRYGTYYGKLSVALEDEMVSISDNGAPSVKFLRVQLLPVLYQCGERFMDILRYVSLHTADYNLESVYKLSADTKQALQKVALIQ
ncbi:MAG: hypothetical protein GY797_16830 [Deltaproteobacteria bacterium]|nr:hypothetical protein [Deltaproteobacteria bacterium]